MALQFPSNRTDYLGTIKFTPVDKTGAPAGGAVELYLPSSMQQGDKIELENVNLGAAMGAAVSAMQPGADMTMDQFMGNATVKDAMALGAQKLVAGMSDTAGAAFREVTRTAPNPNTRAIFKQVSLRSFQYTFKMIPNNEGEATSIAEIIKSFRTNMYPEKIGESLGYKFPTRYKIEAFYDGRSLSELGYNVKTEPCYLESLMTNYNPSSQAFMKASGNSYFSEIDLSLTFIEGKPLDRKSIEAGF